MLHISLFYLVLNTYCLLALTWCQIVSHPNIKTELNLLRLFSKNQFQAAANTNTNYNEKTGMSKLLCVGV